MMGAVGSSANTSAASAPQPAEIVAYAPTVLFILYHMFHKLQ